MTEAMVLVTHCNTIVCLDNDGQSLLHRPLQDISLETVFLRKADQLVFLPEYGAMPLEVCDLLKVNGLRTLQVFPQGNKVNSFGIIDEGKFACAEENGTITFSRISLGAWECFSLMSLVEAYSRKVRLLRDRSTDFPRFRKSSLIPKVIHQIHIGMETKVSLLPATIKQNIEDICSKNLQYQFRLWFEKDIFDFIYDSYGYDVLASYLQINPHYPAARADFFRYLCIYKLGGIYLDIKAGCRVPFDNFLQQNDEFIISQWNNNIGDTPTTNGLHDELLHIDGGEFQQWHIMSTAGHRFLEEVIDVVMKRIAGYDRNKHGVGKMGVIRTTGPIAYTTAIHNVMAYCNYRRIDAEGEGLIFNAIGSRGGIFRRHYSLLDEPVIL